MPGDRIRQPRQARVRSGVRGERRHVKHDTAEMQSSMSLPTRAATRDPICVLIKHKREYVGI